MIAPSKPEIPDDKTREEVRKALQNLADQMNRELNAIRQALGLPTI
jgi:hypothetical protein